MANKRLRDVVNDVVFADPSERPRTHSTSVTARKDGQLSRAIARSLQRTLDIDIDDPDLDGLTVVEVKAADGGLYVAIVASAATASVEHQQQKLAAALPVFRTALAAELSRKRVPTVCFCVVPAALLRSANAGADA